MSSFKTKLCKHWLRHGLCQFGSKCQFAHGERELERMERERMEHDHKRIKYEHESMEREHHKLVHVSSYDNKHESRYNHHDKHELKYYHDDNKQKSKYYDEEKSHHMSHFSIRNHENHKQHFPNQTLSSRSYEERVPSAFKEKNNNDMEDGEFVNPMTSPKHCKQAFSPSPSPKRRKLSNNKNDKVSNDNNKSMVTMVEIRKEYQQEDEGNFDLEDLLRISPEDHELNIQNDENDVNVPNDENEVDVPNDESEVNVGNDENEDQTKLKHCASCKNFENRLHQILDENATLKNAIYILDEKYSQIKEAKLNFMKSFKSIESLTFKYHKDKPI